jgi:exodeoxyribonuclease V alpha subunit
MQTHFCGQIERITYTNEETGFTIAKVSVPGRPDLVTVVGNLIAPTPGEMLEMRGEWTTHRKFGKQFKVTQFKTKIPATVAGIRKYLGSGLIKGLGPVMAGRIVDKFGKRTLDIIETEIDRLAEIDGIGQKRIAMIARAWEDQKEIRDVMLFLQSHGIGSGYATKIFKVYGNRSVAVVKENPYRLATEIFGIGFMTADGIAKSLGLRNDSMLRIEAGILFALGQFSNEGHVYYPYELLIDKCRDFLEVDREKVVAALGNLSVSQKITIEDLNQDINNFRKNNKAVYLARFYVCETSIAQRLKTLIHAPKSIRPINSAKAIQWVQDRLSIDLATNQIQAIQGVLDNKALVITGGPGTGKTTIINAVLKIFSKAKVKVMLAAPTGRAAKRMAETCHHDAKTIHRLLEYSLHKGGFQRNENKPLECDVLIVDEASMIDTILMHHLVKALPSMTTFVLVGDVNQLPSVGAGNVLNDIIDSGFVPLAILDKIFRQARTSRIVVNAHNINDGKMPALDRAEAFDPSNDFYFIEQDNPERALEIIIELTTERIPQRFKFHPVDDIQVLTPMHKGVVGASNLNGQLQAVLNPKKEAIIRGDHTYRIGDKVMQIRNNYDKEVFNGDIGRITEIHADNREILISFDSRSVAYEFADLDELVLAYAISVHKSQGSEYPVVIFPILTQHYVLLQRNLIYTAITRGRELVVVVGSRKAMTIGVNNNKIQQRFTRLQSRLS